MAAASRGGRRGRARRVRGACVASTPPAYASRPARPSATATFRAPSGGTLQRSIFRDGGAPTLSIPGWLACRRRTVSRSITHILRRAVVSGYPPSRRLKGREITAGCAARPPRSIRYDFALCTSDEGLPLRRAKAHPCARWLGLQTFLEGAARVPPPRATWRIAAARPGPPAGGPE